jgi:aminodeoxychorismate lyase
MKIYLNGQIIAAEDARISVYDRGFLYGDGLFETIRVSGGILSYWVEHLHRLRSSASQLKLRLPWTDETLTNVARELLEVNQFTEGVLRLQCTRGPGSRGYSPRGADQPTLLITLHPLPPLTSPVPTWRVRTASPRVFSGDVLATMKTTNRLLYILARAEAEAAGADEALILNERGEVAETSSGNIFCFEQDRLLTPPIHGGILPGVTRAVILALAQKIGIPCKEVFFTPQQMQQSQGAFISLSSYGIVRITELDGKPCPACSKVDTLTSALFSVK